MKHYAALLFASALLTGCATQAIPPQQAQLPPPSRLMLYQNIPDTPYGTVVVVRDSGMLEQLPHRRLCEWGVCRFAGGERKAEFRVPPGNISVSIGQDMIENHLCIWRDTGGSIPMTLRAGESRYLRIAGDRQRGFVCRRGDRNPGRARALTSCHHPQRVINSHAAAIQHSTAAPGPTTAAGC